MRLDRFVFGGFLAIWVAGCGVGDTTDQGLGVAAEEASDAGFIDPPGEGEQGRLDASTSTTTADAGVSEDAGDSDAALDAGALCPCEPVVDAGGRRRHPHAHGRRRSEPCADAGTPALDSGLCACP